MDLMASGRAPPRAATSLLGDDPRFQAVLRRIPIAAGAERTTLVQGPTGSGKDLVARQLHATSRRRHQPYVPLHCGTVPDTLFEAELFGHQRGAFTGAVQRRDGIVRGVAGGTLFLDEVDSLSAAAQAKLLRFIETGEYRPVGADRAETVDAWVIAATNQDLEERVRRGLFRADLLYRLAIVRIDVPSLSDRAGDIPLLARHFLDEASGGRLQLSDGAVRALVAWSWPGNVRELRHRIESAAIFATAAVIEARDLGLPIGTATSGAGVAAASLQDALWSMITDGGLTLDGAVRQVEQLLIDAALVANDQNRTRAAQRLGIHVRTIYKKMGV